MFLIMMYDMFDKNNISYELSDEELTLESMYDFVKDFSNG